MKKFVMLLFLLSPLLIHSQNKDKEEVMKVVNRVFEAMKTNDSTLLQNCFTSDPNTFTVFKNQQGKTNLAQGDFQKFKAAIGKEKNQVWNEPIWNEKVEIDGDLASVWVDYAFYVDDQFSHCGVDAFHLVKQSGEWKIFHLVDTRRRQNCELPNEYIPMQTPKK